MSFWRGETLAAKLPDLVKPFRPGSIDGAAYTLCVGHEIYVSPDQTLTNLGRNTKEILTTGQGFAIPAGQFAFLLTEEIVTVPDNALALISIKGRTKFKGLINISGFHVDPGYSGRLVFSVLNAGPRPLHLRQGQELFLIWYADLDGPTEYIKKGKGFEEIEPELINGISGEILSLQSLSEKQRVLEGQLKQQRTKANIVISIGAMILVALLLPLVEPTLSAIKNWIGSG